MRDRNICERTIVLICMALVVWFFCQSTVYGETEVEINETNFPDFHFRRIVVECDKDGNGFLSQTECDEVEIIDTGAASIKTCKGVEYFTKLKALYCNEGMLSSLDISKNTALEELSCRSNALEILDLSHNSALKSLDCSWCGLTTLDLTHNPALESVDCGCNRLTTLDLSCNPALKSLLCDGNQLDTLDLSSNFALEILECENNKLTTLDLSCNLALKSLFCYGNQLIALELGNSKFITDLRCYNNQLTTLDVGNSIALKKLQCEHNQLTALDVSKNTNMKVLCCEGNQLPALDIGNCPYIVKLVDDFGWEIYSDTRVWESNSFEYEYPEFVLITDVNTTVTGAGKTGLSIDEKYFPDAGFREYVKQFDINKNGLLSKYEISAVKEINVNEMGIKTLKGVEYFTFLDTLYCEKNALTELDVSQNITLEELHCSSNMLGILDVSNNPELRVLECEANTLTVLDVSKNTALKHLVCSSNMLKALEISKNTVLGQLDCSSNMLSALDVSKNVELRDLECDANMLDSLDVSKNIALRYLGCSSNMLTALDVSKNTALMHLECANMKITELDVSRNSELNYLDCSFTGIMELDITYNSVLARLRCAHTKLAKLDINKCPTLLNLVKENKVLEDEKTLYWISDPDGDGEFNGALWVDRTVKFSNDSVANNEIREFVTRCYRIILGREPDVGGMQTWLNELQSGRKAASEIIDRFVNSPEFQEMNYTKDHAVEILYWVMLDRGSDLVGKANWVSKLENGQPFAAIINGFCVSPEFRRICDSYGIKPDSVTIPGESTTADEKIKAFVQRCYRIILNREPDEGGMNTWFNELKSRRKAASEIIDRFMNSPELSGKNYSHSDSVEILYKAMLGRSSDATGKAHWVAKLENGQPFAAVINGFCISPEFKAICASYGIEPGTIKIQALSGIAEEEALSMLAYKAKEPITKKSESNPTRVEIINPSDTIDMNIGIAVQAVYVNEEKAKEFISRCYQCVLGREASATELANWIGQMTNGTKTPDQIARGFLFSHEFKGKNVSNEDLVKILYKVYMNRDADPEGLATWTEKLDGGTSLKDLLDTFSKTCEFKKAVSEMSK